MLCLLSVAIADGEINSYEASLMREIQEVIAADINLEEIVALCQSNPRKFKQEAIGAIKSVKVTRDEAGSILQLSYNLAITDKPMSSLEKQALIEICQLLEVNQALLLKIMSN